jgi:hypothetical protein
MASGRAFWNEHDPNGMSFCGGNPIGYFDADGRCIEGAANYIYSGGSYGQEYRDASTILNAIGDNTSSPTLAGLMGFASYFTDKAANNVTPSYYVNQAASDYNAAGGGVTGVLGVGNRYNPTASAYDFFSGYDLINGQTLSGVDRASAGLNTLGGALLLGAGVADSFQPGTTPPVTTTLYRAVTDEELNSVQNSGQFSTVPGSSTPVPGVQGKWFYGNLEDAQNWAGQAAARDGGPLTILQTTVPKTVAPVYSQPWVDSIQNPALFYNIGDLNAPIKAVSPPITGGAK